MENKEIDIASYLSDFGIIHVASSGKGLFSLDFYGSREDFVSLLADRFGVSRELIREDHVPKFAKLFRLFEDYFAGLGGGFDLDLDLRGTPFQLALWRELFKVPFGSLISYGELAKRAGSPRGARAAGNACRANPVPLIVPCHRVLSLTGKLGGYSAGFDARGRGRKGKLAGVGLKRALLKLEGVDI